MTYDALKYAGIACAAVLFAAVPARGQLTLGALYGVNSGSGGNFLARIDKSNGAVTVLGNTGLTIDGLAISHGGEIFAADNGGDRFVVLNPTTGGITRIVGSYGADLHIEALEFRPDGTLWAVDHGSDRLATVNLATGAVTLYSNTLGAGSVAGMAFNQSGSTLYVMSHSSGALYTVNLATGVATFVGSGGGGSSGGPLGMSMDPVTGALYVAEWRGGASMTLATVNPTSGSRTTVGTMTGGLQIEGLAFVPIPEPPAAVLLASGAALVAGGYYRRRLRSSSGSR